jgi:hypothetical protein
MSLQDKKLYELNLNIDEVNTVLGGLGELPARVSMGLIQNIQSQCMRQDQPAQTEHPSQEE